MREIQYINPENCHIIITYIPENISLAYSFLRSFREEKKLLKIDIQASKEENDINLQEYLSRGMRFLNENLNNIIQISINSSENMNDLNPIGSSINKFIELDLELTKQDFKPLHSIAYYIKDEIEKEISLIEKELKELRLKERVEKEDLLYSIYQIIDSLPKDNIYQKLKEKYGFKDWEVKYIMETGLSDDTIVINGMSEKEDRQFKIESINFVLEYLKHLRGD